MKRSEDLAIGFVQQACAASDSLARAIVAIGELAAQGAQVIVLPELHNGPYFCQHEQVAEFDRAEAIPGPTTTALGQSAKEHGVVVVGSIFERRAPGLYHNTAVVLDADGTLAGMYRKMHIPDDPGFYEKFYFTPGDLGFNPVDTRYGRLGVLVCWDQWFPEAARLMALAGAELLCYPTAIGWDLSDDRTEQERQRDAWLTMQRAHAIANGIPVAACNRIGFESTPDTTTQGGIQFWGSSFIAGPQGELLALGALNEPSSLLARIPRRRSDDVRRIWPFLRDRRIDAYGDLLLRYRDPETPPHSKRRPPP